MKPEWCLQCGELNRPEKALGKDLDGEPACRVHMLAPPIASPPVKVEPVKPAKVVQPETRSEVTIDLKAEKKCPGYERPCTNMIGLRAELCSACYARLLYHSKNGAARKAVIPKTERSLVEISLAALKADLLAKLAHVEAVERMLQT